MEERRRRIEFQKERFTQSKNYGDKISSASNIIQEVTSLENSPETMPYIVQTIEEAYKVLIPTLDFSEMVQLLNDSSIEDTNKYLEVSSYVYLHKDLAKFFHQYGYPSKAKFYFKNISEFCLIAIKKTKLCKLFCRIISTEIEDCIPILKDLNFIQETLEDIIKIMKQCESNKPLDFGFLRSIKAKILKSIGNRDAAKTEYKKAVDYFRRLLFDFIEKKDEDQIGWTESSYGFNVDYLFQFYEEMGDFKNASDTYEKYLKKIDVVREKILSKSKLKKVQLDAIFWGLERRLALGRYYFCNGNYQKAESNFKRLIEDNSHDIERRLDFVRNGAKKISFAGVSTSIKNCDIFDILDMILQCRIHLNWAFKYQKSDIYMTENMQLIWQRSSGKTDRYQDRSCLNAALTLCIKTYWTEIHNVNLNEFYFNNLSKFRTECLFDSRKDDNDNFKMLTFCLRVLKILKNQSDKKYLHEFYEEIYRQYFVKLKYYDEAMDLLMEWLDSKERDLYWTNQMLDCLTQNRQYVEAFEYFLDVVEYLKMKNLEPQLYQTYLMDRISLFVNIEQCCFSSELFEPFLNYYELKFGLYYKSFEVDEVGMALLDFKQGKYAQNILKHAASLKPENLTILNFINLATFPSEINKILNEEMARGYKNFFQIVRQELFCGHYHVQRLQDKVLSVLVENYVEVHEEREDVLRFANSCYLTRFFRNVNTRYMIYF